MYSITYIRNFGVQGYRVMTMTTPSRRIAETVHDALVLAGVKVRLWDKKDNLVTPSPGRHYDGS